VEHVTPVLQLAIGKQRILKLGRPDQVKHQTLSSRCILRCRHSKAQIPLLQSRTLTSPCWLTLGGYSIMGVPTGAGKAVGESPWLWMVWSPCRASSRSVISDLKVKIACVCVCECVCMTSLCFATNYLMRPCVPHRCASTNGFHMTCACPKPRNSKTRGI
jgi:hypothetical protein